MLHASLLLLVGYVLFCTCLATFRHYEFRRDAIELAKKAKWDDEGPQAAEAVGDGGGGVAARDSQVGDLIIVSGLNERLGLKAPLNLL